MGPHWYSYSTRTSSCITDKFKPHEAYVLVRVIVVARRYEVLYRCGTAATRTVPRYCTVLVWYGNVLVSDASDHTLRFRAFSIVSVSTGTGTAKRYVGPPNTATEGEDERGRAGGERPSARESRDRRHSRCLGLSRPVRSRGRAGRLGARRTSRRRVRAAGHHPSAIPTPNHPEPTPCFRNGKRANRREASHQPNGRILTAVRKLIREALIKTRERGGEW